MLIRGHELGLWGCTKVGEKRKNKSERKSKCLVSIYLSLNKTEKPTVLGKTKEDRKVQESDEITQT